jgi:rhodanese-related sulfurtransferase
MKLSSWILSALTAVTLGGSYATAQAPFRQNTEPDQNHAQEIDPKLLIKSQQAFSLIKKENPLLVDVRSREEYNAEHIAGALSYPFRAIQSTTNYPFQDKERQMLLYCGCPHHLSGMSADILLKRGFKKVKVIDEGYWGWKALNLPVMVNPNAPAKMSMDFEGRLTRGGKSAVYEDVLLVHPETGQIEATRTDKSGHFRMALHFYNSSLKDKVEFEVNNTTLKTLTLEELKTQDIQLDIPLQVASQD